MSWLNKQTLNKQKDSKSLYKGLYKPQIIIKYKE